jgi:hypothetical protein
MRGAASRSAIVASLVSGVALSACSPGPLEPRFVRSCRGEYVDFCRPYTYAQITAATFGPEALPIGDPSSRAHVTVTFETCGAMTPTQPRIDLSALLGQVNDSGVPSPIADGGSSSARVIPLASIPPATDPAARTIDVMIDNPFFADVPEDTLIILQFTPVIDSCAGEVFRVEYRTGEIPAP